MVSVRARPRADGWICEIAVDHDGQKTAHTVTVTADDVARYAQGRDARAVEHLVERSFAFLLEREPAASILREFDLSVIRRYFPEFDQTFMR